MNLEVHERISDNVFASTRETSESEVKIGLRGEFWIEAKDKAEFLEALARLVNAYRL